MEHLRWLLLATGIHDNTKFFEVRFYGVVHGLLYNKAGYVALRGKN